MARQVAVTGAMRFDGTSTPEPMRMRFVALAASPMPMKRSAYSICES